MLEMRSDGGHVIRIEEGEEVIGALTELCARQGIEAGFFQGIGAVIDARLGYYDHATGAYLDRTFTTGMEVVAFSGNISRKADGSLFAHAHMIVSGREMETFGGHCFEARAHPTLEIILRPIAESLNRVEVPGKSAQLLDL